MRSSGLRHWFRKIVARVFGFSQSTRCGLSSALLWENAGQGAEMARYYFHLVEGERTYADDNGEEHHSAAAAIARASEMAKEFLREFGAATSWHIDIVDFSGALVGRVTA